MANFLITTPGQVTRGTTEADAIVFGTGGVSAATVIGNKGADTITINGEGATFQSVDFMMNEGHDLLSIDFSGNIKSSNFFGGGKGNDVISLTNATGASVLVAKGGSGRDTISVGGNGSQISIGGNAGHDAITYSGVATKSYVGGGKGNDTITLSGSFGGSIYGGLLNDSIDAETIGTATVLNGDSGNDSVTVTAVVGSGTFINGNAGNDTITVVSLAADNTVAGGNNADVITVSAIGTGMVAGGKGHDDITVSGAATTTVYGGAGADTIDLGADDAVLKVNAGDSTVGTMDVVSGGFAIDKFVYTNVTAVAASATTVIRSGSNGTNTTVLQIADGVIASGNFAAVSGMGVTATVTEIDKLSQLSKGGNTVAFEKDHNTYLFIQGGTVGSTADDVVVKFAGTGIAALTVSGGTELKLAD